MFDAGWVGGLTEARKIAAMAEAHHLPIAPHDCTGPLTYLAGVHLDFAVTNYMVQETVRAYIHGWYADLVTTLPRIVDGYVLPPVGVGLCTELQPGLLSRPRRARHLIDALGPQCWCRRRQKASDDFSRCRRRIEPM